MGHGAINEASVKATTGYPSKSDISKILETLFNYDIKTCYECFVY